MCGERQEGKIPLVDLSRECRMRIKVCALTKQSSALGFFLNDFLEDETEVDQSIVVDAVERVFWD